MTIKTILVDDENKALSLLKDKLNELCPNLEIIGTFNDPEKAIGSINEQSPELIFVDINMPRINGFQLLDALEELSAEVIFVTAYEEYAIKAIEKSAIGYVVKPIEDTALKNAVENAEKSIHKSQALLKNNNFVSNIKDSSKRRLAIALSDGIEFPLISDIFRIEGYEGYTKFFIDQRVLVSSRSLGHYCQILEGEYFFLTHRSHLVNLSHVVRITSENMVHLTNDDSVPLSRRRKKDFIHLLQS